LIIIGDLDLAVSLAKLWDLQTSVLRETQLCDNREHVRPFETIFADFEAKNTLK
jgi:hypothetical protein